MAWHQLGKVYLKSGKFDDALSAFEFSIISDETFTGAYIEKGKAEGAVMSFGCGEIKTKNGQFVGPVVFEDVHPSMSIFRDEIFGPVISVTPFDTGVISQNQSLSFSQPNLLLNHPLQLIEACHPVNLCLLYTSDAADE